jgi:AraC-like DNA-binding protein
MVPGQVHSWNFDGFTDGYIINFSGSFFQTFLLNPSYHDSFSFFGEEIRTTVIDLPEKLHQKIIDLFESILNEAERKDAAAIDMIRLLMLQLFITIDRVTEKSADEGPASYNQTLLSNFQKLTGEHYASIKLPKDYAKLLYITPNHLNAICKDLLGKSAGEVIRNRMVLEAKRLLTNPRLNINAIASMLNFSDNSYFTKFFKKFEGKTPEEFRKEIIGYHRHE